MPESNLNKFKNYFLCSLYLGRTTVEKGRILWHLTKNLRVRFGLAKYHPLSVYQLPTRYGTLFLRDNFGDITNLPNLFHQNTYRVEKLNGEGVVLDVGANVGFFAAWISYHNPKRKIFCFEPLAENAKLISMNCSDAHVNQFGLGEKAGTIQLDVDQHQIMASNIKTSWPTKKQMIEIKTLDDFARKQNIEQVAFMKIDTEGMELDVLEGGRETLAKTKSVAMETHGESMHRGAIHRLEEFGFNILDEDFTNRTGMIFASRIERNGKPATNDIKP